MVIPGLLGGIPGLGNFLVLPLMSNFHASRGTVIFLIEMGWFGMYIASPIVGRVLLRIEPWMVMLFGTIAAGAAFLVASSATTLGVAAAGYIIAQTLGFGCCGLLTSQTIIVRRFPEKLGVFSGTQTVALAGMGVILTLIVAPSIVAYGWRMVVTVYAIVLLVVVPGLVLFVLRGRTVPKGPEKIPVEATAVINAPPAGVPTMKQILAMPSFWLLVFAIVPVGILAQAISVNVIPFYAERGIDTRHAGTVLAGIGAAAAVGALSIGKIVSYANPAVVIAVIAAIAIAGMAVLSLNAGPPALVFIIVYAALSGVAPTLAVGVQRIFGNIAYAPILGLVGPFFLLSAFSGAGAGWLRDRLGDYQHVFGILGMLMVVSLLSAVALSRRPMAEQ
ncbi:MFS transporter [Acidocella aquatica]|uniref:MFS transporter n=1 Tax=Acidocella aquatica TaxID=1922313 RepID=A0ABQ6A7A5_9PROT|nr:MFS transporter [Acidocella aquatica]